MHHRSTLRGSGLGALLTVSALLVACSPGGPVEPDNTSQVAATYTIEEFLGTTNVFGASFSPDHSKLLVSSDASGVFNAYAVDVESGEMTALTESKESIRVVGYFPDDERFLYLSDQGGNELDHLFVRDLDGSVIDLTPGAGLDSKLKANFAGWAEDERTFFLLSNERDARYFDLFEVAVDDFAITTLFEDNEGLAFGGLSPDKRFIAFNRLRTRADSDLVLHDLDSREALEITAHEGEISNNFQDFSPDGAALYYTTDKDSEYQYLMRYDMESGEHSEVLRPDWDVTFARFSRDGQYLVAGINNDARTELRLFRIPEFTAVALPKLAGLNMGGVTFSDDSSLMAFYASSSQRPRDLYLYSLDGTAPKRLTQSLNPAIDAGDLVSEEIVRFASYDGVEIPGLLMKPHGASAENKVPALVWVHGGPGGQSRIGYSGLRQYLVNHGYAVYAINNRGSSGYGKTFFQLDDRKHGEADLGDCVASKQMLIDTGWIDAERVGIIGGSYGGYMVVAALAFEPEAFEVGVDLFGVTNWLRTMRSIPPWWEAARESLFDEMGDPEVDEEYLKRISPLFHAEKITKPLMVLQGANDPRVLQSESDEIVEKVKANQVPVEYIIFPDEGHGFRKKANQEKGNRQILEFLDRYLKGEAEDSSPANHPTGDETGTH